MLSTCRKYRISGNLSFKIYQGEGTPAVLNASLPVSELPGSVTFLPLDLEDTIPKRNVDILSIRPFFMVEQAIPGLCVPCL